MQIGDQAKSVRSGAHLRLTGQFALEPPFWRLLTPPMPRLPSPNAAGSIYGPEPASYFGQDGGVEVVSIVSPIGVLLDISIRPSESISRVPKFPVPAAGGSPTGLRVLRNMTVPTTVSRRQID